jgi:CDGSH iron-sulfur domain-containing protein 3
MEKPKIAQKSPYVLDMEAGSYFWCACGQSAKQPFCDGSHKTTEFKPIKVSIEHVEKKAWCGCKQTSNPPFCDGAHKKL